MVAYAPELLLLISIDIFLVLSLVTCLFDNYFPTSLPYLLQILSLAGFGQLCTSKAFMTIFTRNGRFWFSLFFLVSSLACVVATNLYLLLVKRRRDIGIAYLGGVTMPVSYFTLFFISIYLNEASLPINMFPTMPLGMGLVFLSISTGFLCLGIVVSMRPKFIEFVVGRFLEIVMPFFISLSKTYEDGMKQVRKEKIRGGEGKESHESVPIPYLLDQMQKLEEDKTVPE